MSIESPGFLESLNHCVGYKSLVKATYEAHPVMLLAVAPVAFPTGTHKQTLSPVMPLSSTPKTSNNTQNWILFKEVENAIDAAGRMKTS